MSIDINDSNFNENQRRRQEQILASEARHQCIDNLKYKALCIVFSIERKLVEKTFVGSGSPIKVQSGLETIVVHDLYLDDRLVLSIPLEIMEEHIKMALDAPTIRLSINKNGSINTITWPEESGMFKSIDDAYASVDALPDWVQRKLAVLMLLDADEPNKKEVVDIGRRISENVYWIYLDGSNTGKESKDQST
jgi:hypothetical protein